MSRLLRFKQPASIGLRVSLALMLVLITPLATASVEAYPCLYCGNDSVWELRAAQLVKRQTVRGATAYLYSFEQREIRKFNTGTTLSTSRDAEVQWLPVEARYLEQFEDMLAVWGHFGVPHVYGMPLSAVVHPVIAVDVPESSASASGINVGGMKNVYSLLSSPRNVLALMEWVQEQRVQLLSTIADENVANSLLRLLESRDPVRYNGESFRVTYKLGLSSGGYVHVADTGGLPQLGENWPVALDRRGAPLWYPANAPAGAGFHEVHAEELADWVAYMRFHGATVSVPGSSVESYKITCLLVGGDSLNCTPFDGVAAF